MERSTGTTSFKIPGSRNKPLKAEKSPQSGKENLTVVSAVSISLMEKSYPLTMKISFYIALMLKISGFQPDLCDIQPKRLKENLFPTLDDASRTLQLADAFIKLTTSAIALTSPSILTLDASVLMLATKGRHVDADDGLMKKTFKQLITNEYC
jgi:hypothetical protein